jgi:hypothetical protein
MRLFICLVFAMGLLAAFAGCADNENNATTPPGADQPTANATPTPTPSPQNVDQPWDKVTLARYVLATNCQSVFTVMDAGGWTWEKCADTDDATSDTHGNLTASEQAELERRATAALNSTQRPDACTDELVVDKDYVRLQDEDGTEMRDFRPNNDCHTGGTQEVPALRTYIRNLRAKYTTEF